MWNRLENFFLNNKSARALQLDAQFTNTRLEQFDGVKAYCTRLKTHADSLKNVGDKVSDNRMALQLLKKEQGNATDLVTESSEEAHVSQSSSSSQHLKGDSSQNSARGGGSQPARGGRKPKGKGGAGGHDNQQAQQPPQHQ
ncbi:uncharacterized protein LOC110717555 [Chenopodium quinoa]|uniref:uncharacterized protein LOC110717555 n=1 Tax=Chenopodium quinoa TaxID=63459 RepID=UPI000B7777B7|nr:uncharacterized protein LOC110717555 [Chenopodium quinoa]